MAEENTGRTGGSDGGSPFACLGCVLTVVVLWALVFGVTYADRHYGLSCTTRRGVEVTP